MDLLNIQKIHPALGSISHKAEISLKPVAHAQDQFHDAMQSPAQMDVPMPLSHGDRLPAPNGSLGDSILSGVNHLSSNLQNTWSEVQKQKSSLSKSASIVELVKFQGQVLEMGVMLDVVSKGVSKAVQNVEQLTKVQ